ncbi:glycerol kinase [Ruminococcaceae bacterium FB2012]|nr:glycerol kinase [Ruminococcaceae bacterium FB2012]
MKKYILALDQGTTSSRAVLFEKSGRIAGVSQLEYTQIYPGNGWVEHDANEIFSSQLTAAREVLKKCGASVKDISAVGITNQRETTILWDKNTGEPVCNAIVWQCRRTSDICEGYKAQGLEKFFRDKTGLLIDPYFSATKIKWILNNVPGVRERADRGEILFGTVDCWLIWKLTGGKVHATDMSNASRTMLFNIHTLKWDKEILGLLGIPESILPAVVPSSGEIGVCDASMFGAEIPITGCAGDQQAALFGQKCFNKGDVKNTYGTGGFLLMNIGSTPVASNNGLLTTVGWGIGDQVTYALEGSVFIAGAAVKWLRDEMGLITTAAESERIASSVESTEGVYIVPAFTGLGAPYWNPDARGIITGLTRGSGRAHIVRAVLEAIAYQTADVLKAMEEDVGRLGSIRVDGGASSNNFLMQFQSDILGMDISRPENVESTAIGAAFLAGLASGFWSGIDEIISLGGSFEKFSPVMSESQRVEHLKGWAKAVECANNY